MVATESPCSVVLFVCTANICRSAMAQLVLRDALSKANLLGADLIEVMSAGVYAETDAPIAEKSAALLAARSVDSTAFRSRRLTPDLVLESDVVLCAAMEHRRTVVEMCPSASPRAFTLLEFAWLLSQVPACPVTGEKAADRLRSSVVLARGQRGLRMPEGTLDLPDPYGRRMSAYRKTLAQIDTAVQVILDRLVPEPRTSSPVR